MRFVIIIFVAVLMVPLSVYAQMRQVPQSTDEVVFSYAPLVKKTAPAVVNIYTKVVVDRRMGRGFSPFLNDPFFQQFFGREFGGMSRSAPMRKRLENALGSGVIVAKDGMVMTNAHVVKNAEEIIVVLSDGEEFTATPVMIDERTDLAVLQIDTQAEIQAYLEMADSDAVEVGDIVLAIGNPFGVGQTVTSGIVSAVSRTASSASDFNFFIQTDAAINPGNSGGALIDMQGKLIGINASIFSKSGGSLGIGFAIPSNMVKVILQAARTNGKIVRSWFGVSAQKITRDIADSLGMKRHRGGLVTEIHKASPAGKAGLKTGDIIVGLNGHTIENPAELRFRSAMVEVGKPIVLDVLRSGKKQQLHFTATAAPENIPREMTELTGNHPFAGIVVANISPAVIEEIGTGDINQTGVIVVDIKRRGRLGLRKGDVIQYVNGENIKSVKQLQKILQKSSHYWQIKILRGKQVLNITLSG